MAEQKLENVVILGGGPAGLTAAIYASRALLEPIVVEGDEVGGQLMTTTDVENFPGFPKGIMGPELMADMRAQAERFGSEFISRNASKIEKLEKGFKITVGKEEILTRSVIVATGASAKYMGLKNELRLIGRGVSACATCDGAFFKNLRVALVGGGDSAMEEATFLTRFASEVTIIHRRNEFRASKIMAERVLKNPKIRVLWNSVVEDVIGENQVEGLKIKNVESGEASDLAVEGFFLAIGHKPNTDIFKGLLEMNEVGYLMTKPHSTYTSVEGIFAAGDVADSIYRQAISAAGTGCMAALDCEKWLERHSHS